MKFMRTYIDNDIFMSSLIKLVVNYPIKEVHVLLNSKQIILFVN